MENGYGGSDSPSRVERLRLRGLPGARWRSCDLRSEAPDTGARWSLQPSFSNNGAIEDIAFSGDGRLIATKDGSVTNLWEMGSDRQIRHFYHRAALASSFALAPDFQLIALASPVDIEFKDVRTGLSYRRRSPSGAETEYRLQALWTPRGPPLVAFAGNSQTLVSGFGNGIVHIFATDTGTLREVDVGPNEIEVLAASRDGARFATGGSDGATVWEVSTGQQVASIRVNSGPTTALSFSPDGKAIAVASAPGSVAIWDIGARSVRWRHSELGSAPSSVDWSPNQSMIAIALDTWTRDDEVLIYDARAGTLMSRLQGHNVARFTPDGSTIAAAWGSGLRLTTLATRDETEIVAHHPWILSFASTPDGRFFATASEDGAVLWDLRKGQPVRRFGDHASWTEAVALSADGRRLASASLDWTVQVWDTTRSNSLHRINGHKGGVLSARFSRDGKWLVTGSADKTAAVWDTESGALVQRFVGYGERVQDAMLSPDALTLATGAGELHAHAALWDVASGQIIRVLNESSGGLQPIAFSPSGDILATPSAKRLCEGRITLFDARGGEPVRELGGLRRDVGAVEFSPDGRLLASGCWMGDATIYEIATGREVWRSREPIGFGRLQFSKGGQILVALTRFSAATFIDTTTGRDLALLVGPGFSNWIVSDDVGRYDSSNGADAEGAHWVRGLDLLDLPQLKSHFYEPGLLAKKLGFDRSPLLDAPDLAALQPYPGVRVGTPAGKGATLGIDIVDRGGGIGRAHVSVNGIDVSQHLALCPSALETAKCLHIDLDLARTRYWRRGQENTYEVVAFNAQGNLSSRTARSVWNDPEPLPTDPPRLFIISGGVGTYRGSSMHLRFPPQDARRLAAAIELGARRLFGAERVDTQVLTSDDIDPPTKKRLRAAFDRLAQQARPADTVFVFLAGHGLSQGEPGGDEDFYFPTAEAVSFDDMALPELRAQRAVSGRELGHWLADAAASRRVLVLDTCASGRLIESLVSGRSLPSSRERALQRLKDRAGTWILAGSAADKVSYEASPFGHGLLTYSILEAMKSGRGLGRNGAVDVSTLFEVATDRVPELARGLGGVQRPQLRTARSGSIDLGLLTPDDMKHIELPRERAVMVRAQFSDEARLRDHLPLAPMVNELLDTSSVDGMSGGWVYYDVLEYPGALAIAGQYQCDGDRITLRARLERGPTTIGETTLGGQAGDLPALAAALVEWAAQVVKAIPSL